MTVFYTTLFSTFILSLCSRLFGKKDKNIEILFIILVILIFTAVAALRTNIGDTYAYKYSYTLLKDFNGFAPDAKDKGFTIFSLILYNINTDPQFFVFVTAVITQVFNLLTLVKYRNFFELETYMYFTSGCYLVTMNGIRQAMVGSILFFAVQWVIKGKFIPYVIVVLIMSTMHSSALIMIPIYFIVREEAWSKKTKIIILLAAIGFLGFNKFMPGFFDALGDSSYTEYESMMTEEGQGASPMRFVVNLVPVILAYIKRDRLKELWPASNIFVNMAIINAIVVAFSLYNWIFARFQIYFQLYNFILLPYIIKSCFENRKERDLVYYGFIICYFIFFYYEQVIGGVGLGYNSNYF